LSGAECTLKLTIKDGGIGVMTSGKMYIAAAALAAATMYGAGAAHAQGVAGTWVFHSSASGVCPGLDWHVNSDGHALSGFIAWNEGQSVARVSGALAGNEFKMTATEIGGARTANITGRVDPAGHVLTATLTGMGGPCDGKTVRVPWMSAAAMSGG